MAEDKSSVDVALELVETFKKRAKKCESSAFKAEELANKLIYSAWCRDNPVQNRVALNNAELTGIDHPRSKAAFVERYEGEQYNRLRCFGINLDPDGACTERDPLCFRIINFLRVKLDGVLSSDDYLRAESLLTGIRAGWGRLSPPTQKGVEFVKVAYKIMTRKMTEREYSGLMSGTISFGYDYFKENKYVFLPQEDGSTLSAKDQLKKQ